MANLTKIRLSGTTYNIVDDSAVHSLAGYSTTEQMNAAITAATNALAESIAEQNYQTSGDVQNAITAETTPINNTLTAHTANTDVHVTVADKSAWNAKLDSSDVEGFFGAVNYDSSAKRINFYNESTGGTVLGYVDATDFIKDGMVSNVEIKEVSGKGTCLVITFNSDAGKEAIEIPISQIFDASNYYTTAQTQAYVTGYTYDKQTIDDKISESGTFDPTQYYNKTATDALLANKADTATTYTKTEVDNAITAATSTKQDTLVSGTNIKTVGTQSVLGSGNIALMSASVGTGNDSETLIFDFA
jgi:hypothetical protein